MISYDKLWKLLKEKKISQYYLIKECGISPGTITTLRKNGYVRTVTIDRLCRILECEPADLLEIVEEPGDAISQIISKDGRTGNTAD